MVTKTANLADEQQGMGKSTMALGEHHSECQSKPDDCQDSGSKGQADPAIHTGLGMAGRSNASPLAQSSGGPVRIPTPSPSDSPELATANRVARGQLFFHTFPRIMRLTEGQ